MSSAELVCKTLMVIVSSAKRNLGTVIRWRVDPILLFLRSYFSIQTWFLVQPEIGNILITTRNLHLGCYPGITI